MATLVLRFPGRRYHATPWGHHVNEGLVEWPPSPWRLLRALLSVGYTSALWKGAGPTPAARSLIEKLGSKLPRYILPSAVGAHTRHYMPVTRIEKGREQTTLVFDTWAQLDDGELTVAWPLTLDNDEHVMFVELSRSLGYLGRSESWVSARVGPDDVPEERFNCFPEDGDGLRRGYEQVTLLAPEPVETYAAWRLERLSDALTALQCQGKKVTAKSRRETERAYPSDLLACLHMETQWLRAHGWNQPPGSRRVFYWRPVGALQAPAPRYRPFIRRSAPVEAMLLSLTSASGGKGLLPSVTRTLPQGELLHRALVSQSTKTGRCLAALTGRDAERRPLRTGHSHAHVLPLDLDGDQHLDHVLIWASMMLDSDAQSAIRAIRRTFSKGGDSALRLAVSGAGPLESFRTLQGEAGARLRSYLAGRSGSRTWVSATPFVPPRFLKKKGQNTLEGQIVGELTSRGLPYPTKLDIKRSQQDDAARRHRLFVRERRFGAAPPVNVGFTISLEFAEPARGPICLGYASHFGLGLFRAV
jgi:CRISPR-associated protein Csb2